MPMVLPDDLIVAPTTVEAAATALTQWFVRGNVYVRSYDPRHVWLLADSLRGPSRTLLQEKGYDRFRCQLHRKYVCMFCSCPACGSSTLCTCSARTIKGYSGGPPVPRVRQGVRRIGIEMEIMVAPSRNHDFNANLQALLARYPWCHSDGSLGGRGVEAKLIGYADRLEGIAQTAHTICAGGPGIGSDRCCGLHVHIERLGQPREEIEGILTRWLAQQATLYRLFPDRCHNHYCNELPGDLIAIAQRRGGNAQYLVDSVSEHYQVLNAPRNKPTFEIRLHSGTSSWLLATAWAAFCHEIVSGTPSLLGRKYLQARQASATVRRSSRPYPWAWRRVIERHARRVGFGRALADVEAGVFDQFIDPATLREACITARVSMWRDRREEQSARSEGIITQDARDPVPPDVDGTTASPSVEIADVAAGPRRRTTSRTIASSTQFATAE